MAITYPAEYVEKAKSVQFTYVHTSMYLRIRVQVGNCTSCNFACALHIGIIQTCVYTYMYVLQFNFINKYYTYICSETRRNAIFESLLRIKVELSLTEIVYKIYTKAIFKVGRTFSDRCRIVYVPVRGKFRKSFFSWANEKQEKNDWQASCVLPSAIDTPTYTKRFHKTYTNTCTINITGIANSNGRLR